MQCVNFSTASANNTNTITMTKINFDKDTARMLKCAKSLLKCKNKKDRICPKPPEIKKPKKLFFPGFFVGVVSILVVGLAAVVLFR